MWIAVDIDFHYHATFVAARYAGFSWEDARIIGTTAQMIDENGYGAVAESIPVLAQGTETHVQHVFRPLPTFAGNGDVGSTTYLPWRGSQDEHASIWSVYHFLPGNFELKDSVGNKFRSPRWRRRQWGHPRTDSPALFRWLCRPHSPMAMFLINNCRDFVHRGDTIKNHRLAPYLVGVTMHVFADTWAHQDFTGPPEQRVNDVAGTMGYGFLPFTARQGQSLVPPEDPAEAFTDASWRFRERTPAAGKVFYTGHGRVGHWPDHSGLVWKYNPVWSDGPVVRNNPYQYFDAFLHLVKAMLCIRNDRDYAPFPLTDANVNALFAETGLDGGPRLDREKMRIINELLQVRRVPIPRDASWHAGEIDDKWDQAIANHSEQWRAQMPSTLGVGEAVPTWYPGKSDWIALAKAALDKKGRIGTQRLMNLDYFKFNYAAKLHFRSVKEQLLAWGEQIIGEWNDGSAYVDDYAPLRARTDPWREKIRRVLVEHLASTPKQHRQQGLTLLLQELDEATSEAEIVGKLQLSLTDAGDRIYGLRARERSSSVKAIKELLKQLGVAGTVMDTLTSFGALPSVQEWKEKLSYVRVARRASDAVLTQIDQALADFHAARTDADRAAPARRLETACERWLRPDYTSKETGRMAGVQQLMRAVIVWQSEHLPRAGAAAAAAG
jgi:hypothetical protein